MRVIKRHPFTLLEVLIALGLTSLILSFLLASYYQAESVMLFWQAQDQEVFSERYVQYRLGEVFNKLLPADQEETFFFSLENVSGLFLPGASALVFSYDNGIILDASLAGPVLGILYVDPKGGLTLITWPEKKEWPENALPPHHREILMEGVKEMSFEYFQLPLENAEVQEIGWRKEGWPKEFKYSPAMIKVKCVKNSGKELVYIFSIPELSAVFRLKT